MIFEVRYFVESLGWETRLYKDLPSAFHACIGYKGIHSPVQISYKKYDSDQFNLLHTWIKDK